MSPYGDYPMEPGEYLIQEGDISINAGRQTKIIPVSNTGDRPIQVGSHAHFFEANRALSFPRIEAYGYHLNIPAGTSIRFEPGDTRSVELVEYGGKGIIYGFGGLVQGPLNERINQATEKARRRGYTGI